MSLDALPSELVDQILRCLVVGDPESVPTLISCTSVSRAIRRAALQQTLWRSHARHRWHRGTLLGTFDDDDAFEYYKRRHGRDRAARHNVTRLAQSSSHRVPRIEDTKELGSDVVEELERMCKDPHDDEYPLSIKYWAQETSAAVHRQKAIDTWIRIKQAPEEPDDAFEAGLLAFCAFRGADPDQVMLAD